MVVQILSIIAACLSSYLLATSIPKDLLERIGVRDSKLKTPELKRYRNRFIIGLYLSALSVVLQLRAILIQFHKNYGHAC